MNGTSLCLCTDYEGNKEKLRTLNYCRIYFESSFIYNFKIIFYSVLSLTLESEHAQMQFQSFITWSQLNP